MIGLPSPVEPDGKDVMNATGLYLIAQSLGMLVSSLRQCATPVVGTKSASTNPGRSTLSSGALNYHHK